MAAVSVRMNPLGITLMLLISGCSIFYWFGGANLLRSEPKISMKELLCVGIELAKRGGNRVKQIHDSNKLDATSKGKTKEGAKEMMTEGDLQSHRAIVYGFDKAFPGIKVISEEHERKPVDFKVIPDLVKQMNEVDEIITSDVQIPLNEISVWIDPLDATQEYTEGLTQYVTVMVCVAVNGQPTIGIIHQPFLKETAWGWVAYGTSKNVKNQVNEKDQKTPIEGKEDPVRLIVSRSHAGKVEPLVKDAFDNVNVIPAGGAGYKTLALIKGEADAYVHVTRIKKWDICAGNALLNSLGGRMTTLDGTHIDYHAESNPVVDLGLLADLREHDVYRSKLSKIAEDLKESSQKQPSS
ncbi:inositol monophosphatase 3-like [Tubulanus polymorphus]|uniref:inositol monophosphatase 3-like n=1 Tax=Tubulanus polymorphus TaxID=672921 RepID=UPI003DA2D140